MTRVGASSSRGFTMVELLVVMAILGVLAAAVMPLGEALLRSQKERDLRAALWEIRLAIDAHKRLADKGLVSPGPSGSGYPASLRALVQGVPAVDGESSGRRFYFLRQVPRDPFASPGVSPESSWLLRSYASPPDDPKPGADVFDVRSSSQDKALDGSAYAAW